MWQSHEPSLSRSDLGRPSYSIAYAYRVKPAASSDETAHVHNSTYRNIYLTLSDALRSQLAVTLVDIYKKLCIKPKAGMGEQSDQIEAISSWLLVSPWESGVSRAELAHRAGAYILFP